MMAGTCNLTVAAAGFNAKLAEFEGQVAVACLLEPWRGLSRCNRLNRIILAQQVDRGKLLSRQSLQCFIAVGQGAFSIDSLYDSIIKGSLGFLYIGDGNHANLKLRVYLLQSALQCAFLGLSGLQRAHGTQNAKVSVNRALDQLLLVKIELK